MASTLTASLTQLIERLKQSFEWKPGIEASIEVDPRTVDAGRLAHLKALGFNRLSLGIQDFDPLVQEAVNRIQSVPDTLRLIREAREFGFGSVSVDGILLDAARPELADIANLVDGCACCSLKADVGGTQAPSTWTGNYLVFHGPRPGDAITLTFPVPLVTVTPRSPSSASGM